MKLENYKVRTEIALTSGGWSGDVICSAEKRIEFNSDDLGEVREEIERVVAEVRAEMLCLFDAEVRDRKAREPAS